MKKLIASMLLLSSFSLAHAESDAANIKIRMQGAMSDNRYFLCLPGVGCLSILAGNKGKTYPVLHSFEMNNIYVTNVDNFKVSNQGLPDSCNVTVNTNQTITISGRLTKGPNQSIYINGLHCSIS